MGVPDKKECENPKKSDELLQAEIARLTADLVAERDNADRLEGGLLCLKAICDTPIGRRKMNLDADDERLAEANGVLDAHRTHRESAQASVDLSGGRANRKQAMTDVMAQLDGYILHKRSCDMMSAFIQGKHCTCGLDGVLAHLSLSEEEIG